jgi:YggT family protein
VEILLVLQIKEYGLGPAAGQSVAAAALLALVMILKIGLYVVMAAVIVQVVLSWVSPHSPLMSLANSMTRPFLRVFQRRVPPIGNVDLSPLFVLVVIQLLLMLPVAYLEAVVGRLL